MSKNENEDNELRKEVVLDAVSKRVTANIIRDAEKFVEKEIAELDELIALEKMRSDTNDPIAMATMIKMKAAIKIMALEKVFSTSQPKVQ